VLVRVVEEEVEQQLQELAKLVLIQVVQLWLEEQVLLLL
jgi:hypothetical protein